jgi:hypothetical protein
VKFFNVLHPGDAILVKQDPEYDKLLNKMLAKDKYATFSAGYFETDDPEVIEALNSPRLRAKGVRCMDNPADLAEYGSTDERKTYMEAEIARRVAEALEEKQAIQAHAAASPFETSKAQAAESVAPKE